MKFVPGCGCCGPPSCGASPASLTVTVNTCGIARSGVTVTATLSGATTQSGTTNGSGQVVLSLPNSGTWTVTVTAPSSRLNGATGSTTVTCGGSFSLTFNLSNKSGYHCVTGCWEPLPNNLYYSDACFSFSDTNTSTSGTWFNVGPSCVSGAVDMESITIKWVVNTPGSGKWQVSFVIFAAGSGAICTSFIAEASNHDPADPVSVTFTSYPGGGCDPGSYSLSPWNITITE